MCELCERAKILHDRTIALENRGWTEAERERCMSLLLTLHGCWGAMKALAQEHGSKEAITFLLNEAHRLLDEVDRINPPHKLH